MIAPWFWYHISINIFQSNNNFQFNMSNSICTSFQTIMIKTFVLHIAWCLQGSWNDRMIEYFIIMRGIPVTVRCTFLNTSLTAASSFHGARIHDAICAVKVLNIIAWKSTQILLLMCPISCFFLHRLWRQTYVFRIFLVNYGSYRYST